MNWTPPQPTPDEIARHKAPPVPGNTCPAIDRLSMQFDAVSGDLETFRDQLLAFREPEPEEVREIVTQTIEGLQSAREQLESLRTENEKLRKLGKYWREAHRALSDDMRNAE